MDFNAIKDALVNEFQTNEFFKGGAVIALCTWIVMQARGLPSRFTGLWDRYGAYLVEFDQGSADFDAVLSMVLEMHKDSKLGNFAYVPSYDGEAGLLVPTGNRWHRRDRCLIRTILSKRELNNSSDRNNATTFTLSVTAYGWKKRETLKGMVEAAIHNWKAQQHGKLHVQDWQHGYWYNSVPLPRRTFDNVYSDWAMRIKEDLDAFLAREDDYVRKGIPWRRGYCLYGPPGTGKTSLAIALANYLKRDLRVFERGLHNDLPSILSGDNGLCLVEDIDTLSSVVKERKESKALIVKSGKKKKKKKADDEPDSTTTMFTLGEILNALDGVKSGHGAIVLVTTNHVDSLDPALLRPGRIDMLCEMTYMTRTEWDMLCESYFGELLPCPEGRYTAAEVQGAYQRAGFDKSLFLQEMQEVLAEKAKREELRSG